MNDLLEKIRVFSDSDSFFQTLLGHPHKGACVLAFCNAHAINLAYRDEAFARDLTGADFLLRDGAGVQLAMKLLGMSYGANMNGTDAIPYILNRWPRARLGLYGTCEPWLGKAAAVFAHKHDVIATMDGFQSIEAYVAAIERDKPEIILLGMGMPKQEHLAARLAASLTHRCLIINGGAIMDFTAKRFDRAPMWVRQIGMEWLYRFMKEPRRLLRRYLIGNFVFILRAAGCFCRKKACVV